MDKTIGKIEYTKVIQQINEAIKKLSSAKKAGKKDIIEKTYKELNYYSSIISEDKAAASEAIRNHYNNIVYNLNNGGMSAPNYLSASIIREIMQNIIDCNYTNSKIEILIDFNDETNTITFKYNEEGFKISNVISFLSLNHTTKDSNNTGAFGVGAKGTILNAKRLEIISFYNGKNGHQFVMDISTEESDYGDKFLFINKLSLEDNIEPKENSSTSMKLSLNRKLYNELKNNLLDLTGEKTKGKYITPIDLIFASLKQADKDISIKIADQVIYKIRYDKYQSYVGFSLNNQLLVGFKVFKSKESEFSYLIPYNRNQHGSMPTFVTRDNYNYFSTYELTGKTEDSSKLPKFFINVPTVDKKNELDEGKKYYITSDRKGIQENKKDDVERIVVKDFIAIIDKFEDELLIDIDKWDHRYITKYLYEFIEYKEGDTTNASNWRQIKEYFNSKISFVRGDDISIKLNKVKKFKYDKVLIEEAQKLKSNVFIFMREISDFYGVNGRTTFDLIIDFHIVFYGELLNCKILSDLSRKYKGFSGIKEFDDFKFSDYYKESYINERILYNLNYRDGDEIFLISAESDKSFTEDTLLNLLKAIYNNQRITAKFDIEKKALDIGERRYYFEDSFKVKSKELLYYAYITQSIVDKDEDKDFFDFICNLYKKELFNFNLPVFEKLKFYQKNFYNLYFSQSSNNIIKVSMVYINQREIEIPIDELDISSVEYEQIFEVTGLTNYKLLIGKAIENISINQNITDAYNLDLSILEKYSNLNEIESILDKIFIGETTLQLGKKNLIAFVKGAVLKQIIQTENISSSMTNFDEYDYILIIPKLSKNLKPSKIRLSEIGGILDAILDARGQIKQFFKPVDKTLIKMLDQFNFNLKPILAINKNEIEILKSCLKNTNGSNEKMFIAKDLTSKLYGYSTCCSLCDYSTDILNAFHLEKLYFFDRNVKRTLNLYVCGNHYFESKGWIIIDVNFQNSIGEFTVSFDQWVNQIQGKDCIEPHLLNCEIQVIKRSSYRIFELNEEDEVSQTDKKEYYRFILTPLLAVKWLVDNNF